MKSKLSVLFLFLLCAQFSRSQYRISLDSSNTYQFGLSYLIDIPYNWNIKKLYVDNRNETIPAEIIFSTKNRLWTNVDTLTVLEKTTLAQDTTKKKVKPKYRFDEYIIPGYGPTIKSRGISSKFVKYKNLSPIVGEKPDSLLVYYSEEYGSGCCPRDPRRDLRPSLDEFIKQFEDRFKVKIGNGYAESRGEEGEAIIYLTLDGLTPRQKIDFMDERIYQLIPHKELEKIVRVPTIFMPFLVSKNNLRIYN